MSERAIFRSVPVQVWYGNVMYQAAGLLEKIMYYSENCLSFMKFLSAEFPLTDAKLICMPLYLLVLEIRPWISSRVMRRGAK